MTAADHRVELEELMAWLDGELSKPDAERVRAHAAGCDECRRMEADIRQVSSRLSEWSVTDANASLRVFGRAPFFGSGRTRWMQVAALVVITVGGVVLWQSDTPQQPEFLRASRSGSVPAGNSLTEAAESAYAESLVRLSRPALSVSLAGAEVPLVARTARLTLVPRDFESARSEMERIVRGAGGYIGQISVSDARAGARSLGATLRIPANTLAETLKELKSLGHVTSESQQGEDVTQQSVDLDARLSNARASEARLKQILETRTGRLSDVLDVEREIARVRGEIEGMQAQRKVLDRRITYAEVTLRMTEERKAAVDLGPLPVGAQIRNALVDGWSSAITSAIGATVAVARIAPALLLWGLVLALPAWWLKRRLVG